MTHWGGGWKAFRSAHPDVQPAVDLLESTIKSKLLCKKSRSVCSDFKYRYNLKKILGDDLSP